jgi:hypothetical protein
MTDANRCVWKAEFNTLRIATRLDRRNPDDPPA